MRTLIAQTPSHIGETVTIKGWVNSIRAHGQISFADIRDRSGVIQVVGDKKLANLNVEDVVEIEGLINARDEKYFNPKMVTGKVEMAAKDYKLLSPSQELPFDIHQPDLNISLPVLLDNRAVSLRHHKVQDVFKVQAVITRAFRDFLNTQSFTEIHVPTIVAGATEGGSEVFKLDYFGHQAYLAQSPQLYKQILTSVFERVFTVARAYRAEPSVTTRHITEYVSLDAEMSFIDSWEEVMRMADASVRAIFKAVETECADVLVEYNTTIPKTALVTPHLKLKEALQIIYDRTGRDVRNELDMDPEGEREICRYSLEEFGSELIFITHFYTKKRAWYSYADPANPEETLSFDLIGRGVEWISGSQRIHEYQTLIDKIKSKGMDPASFEMYLQAFRHGMPPEGGWAIGLERVTQNILGLENIRQATLFPRDMERVDRRLSSLKTNISLDLNKKLVEYLTEKQAEFKQLEHEEVKTSAEAAKARGTKIEQGAKALVMFADNTAILVVLSAAQKLDNAAFKKQFEIKDLRMASPEEVAKISGVPIGAVPPFGNLFNVVTYVDKNLLAQAEIAFNAGSRTKSIIMKSSDLIKTINPKIGEYAI